MDRKKLGFWVPILVLAAALLMLAVSTGTVDAARGGVQGAGGKGGGGGSTSGGQMTCFGTPNVDGTTLATAVGSGFSAGKTYLVGVVGYFSAQGMTADSGGSFTYNYSHFMPPGTYKITAAAQKGGNWVQVASCTFTV